MFASLRPALVLLGILTLVTGVLYPLTVTVGAQVLFPAEANGSLVIRDGRIIGSTRIGQEFDDPRYFWGRPSATGPQGYNASASAGSNLGPSNPALLQAVEARVSALRANSAGDNPGPVPVDLATASGSGLDPDISPAAALYQVGRVAQARGLPDARVRALVEATVEDRTLGLLGERRVNVLRLNLALDALTQPGT
jgi:K+-transporting ATPase ATPase C chain